MPIIPTRLPTHIPTFTPSGGVPSSTSPNQTSLYDIALGGLGFMYANTGDNPFERATAQYEKERIDQAETPGEQTLTGWWLKSQDSFHGGAGQLYLEPAVETPVSHVRFDLSKNVDPFTPGRVTRLPDTNVISLAAGVLQVLPVVVAGADAVIYLKNDGTVHLVTNLDGVPVDTGYDGLAHVIAIATDGSQLYALASFFGVFSTSQPIAATSATPVSLRNYGPGHTTGTLGWVKSRLMAAVDSSVYEVDVSTTASVASELRFTHPTPGWVWRCFGDSPTSILAAGDASQVSEVVQFTVSSVAGAPVLQVAGTAATMPIGERVLSLGNVMGAFQAVGTTRGIRMGEYATYTGALQLGPLQLLPTDPTIPCNTIVARDRFFFAVGQAYDEPGLIAIDLSSKTDQAGRFAWAPHLVPPVDPSTSTATGPATAACVLVSSSRIVFYVPGVGLLLEGVGPGTARPGWLRTSRIRFATTEPKLFKIGSIRADVTSGQVAVRGDADTGVYSLSEFDTTTGLPDFRLPYGQAEFLTLTFTVTGNGVTLRSYAVKALPGTRRQRRIKLVLSLYDSETTRTGQKIRASAPDRLAALEELDAGGDELVYEEFSPEGTKSTLCVIETMDFQQSGRPTPTSAVGGTVTVTLRTVDS